MKKESFENLTKDYMNTQTQGVDPVVESKVVKWDMEYEPSPTAQVIIFFIAMWALACTVLWYPVGWSIGTALFVGSVSWALVLGLLHPYFITNNDADQVEIRRKIYLRMKAGSTGPQVTDTIHIPEMIRAVAPGLNFIFFEKRFGDLIDTTKAVLFPIKIDNVKDKNNQFWNIEGSGPITPITGKYAARYPFVDVEGAKTYYKGVFERAIVRGFSVEDGNEINKYPKAFSHNTLKDLLGGENRVVDDEIRWAHVAGLPFLTKVEQIASTREISQIAPKVQAMAEGVRTLIAAGASQEQVGLMVLVASGKDVDLTQLNLGGAGGLIANQGQRRNRRKKK